MKQFVATIVAWWITITLTLGLANPVAASNWRLAAETANGQTRQYLNSESLHLSGSIATVETYVVDVSQPEQRIYYITEYHCGQARYKDIVLNGEKINRDWQSIVSDPLNQAVMDYACPS